MLLEQERGSAPVHQQGGGDSPLAVAQQAGAGTLGVTCTEHQPRPVAGG